MEKVQKIMTADGEKQRVCKKCLTRDMIGMEDYFRTLREYIENLDIDIKSSDKLYEDRLTECKQCDFLLEGMCRKCGCYVEMRAALTKNVCPAKKW